MATVLAPPAWADTDVAGSSVGPIRNSLKQESAASASSRRERVDLEPEMSEREHSGDPLNAVVERRAVEHHRLARAASDVAALAHARVGANRLTRAISAARSAPSPAPPIRGVSETKYSAFLLIVQGRHRRHRFGA